ncbi:Mss4-like protein [Fusarium sp. MPI-SDFR-AT-0072]|nr:Mss4-like protein [Fusarium sp. MPI-SDFR-AT-0072]
MHRITCLCGNMSRQLGAQPRRSDNVIDLSLCHCNTCRYSTGLLCTSYVPTEKPNSFDSLSVFDGVDGSSRYFCSTCGCHIFQSLKGGDGELSWGVATGVIICSDDSNERVRYAVHQKVEDTADDGASIWIPLEEQQRYSVHSHSDSLLQTTYLDALCACEAIHLRITRPNTASYLPHRNYTDLMHPHCSTEESITSNPSDEKWWVQGDKYLAGTCACESCRLASGFEIQTWAFIPRANISIFAPDSSRTEVPLDFESLPTGALRSYQSSQGVVRHFCGGCGATVFWRGVSDPSVVDVSVGLFRADEGARAENWVHWFTGRTAYRRD